VRAVEIVAPGGPEMLRLTERADPDLASDEVLVRVVAAGVNRPDVQQRRGLYPPPPGASDIPGLDIAGIVERAGVGVEHLHPGDAVTALVASGGYADVCVVPAVQCLPVPGGLTFLQAAVLPEVFFTAWNNVMWLGRLGEGETLLFQGGASGVGMAAIQIASQLRGARVFVTAGTEEKRQACLALGAEAAVDYRGDWAGEVRALNGGRGIDLIVDAQAGPYTQPEMDLLADDGRLVLLASHLGTHADIDLRQIVRRRLTLTGSTIRPRPPAYKGRIAAELLAEVWPRLESGAMRMPVCASFPLEDVARAHELLDANLQIGKVALAVDEDLAGRMPAPGGANP
jgi:putative PIG3 family NAD(P)H quinone oxidoreductase